MFGGQLMVLARAGGQVTICMFGQTGTGKTHSTASLLDAAFAQLHQPGKSATLQLQSFEVAGRTCRDLLHPGPDLQVLTEAGGIVQVSSLI